LTTYYRIELRVGSGEALSELSLGFNRFSYGIGPEGSVGQARLSFQGQFTTTVEQVAYAFLSPGNIDLVFTRLMKIIQVPGCFWHQHSGCPQSHLPKSRIEYWQPKLTKNKRRDKKNETMLRALGWDVLTLWECDLKNVSAVSQSIRIFLSH
jgi:DNA mismatch endonuclease Vsr